ncbi:hypothetical protein [Streptomyces sp. NPDC060002]|uniref:hypothetical protein n=1 Tax=Streptomyces sp. NPDC060002 TaxID=3347033 RepID=UPI00367CB9D5
MPVLACLLDAIALMRRRWNSDGIVEDAATGGATGSSSAHLRRQRRIVDGELRSCARDTSPAGPAR